MTVNLKHPDRLYIGGEWVEPRSDSPIDIVSPDTGQVVYKVAGASAADMARAVAAAREAFDDGGWSRSPAEARIEALDRLADALERREAELAEAWSLQIGGLPGIAPFLVRQGTENIRNAVKIGRHFRFELRAESAVAEDARIVREPVGVANDAITA